MPCNAMPCQQMSGVGAIAHWQGLSFCCDLHRTSVSLAAGGRGKGERGKEKQEMEKEAIGMEGASDSPLSEILIRKHGYLVVD
jgi:hypothetical protein